MGPARGTARPAVALLLAAACWGTGTAVSKQAVASIPPLTLLAVQLVVSIAFLTLAGSIRAERLRTNRRERSIARLGILNPGLSYALGLLGLTTISASLSVLIWALEPLLILGLAAILLRERLTSWLLGLSAVAVSGVMLVLVDPAAGGQLGGIVVSTAGVLCCAIYTVAARRWIAASDSTVAVVLAQEVWALAFAAGLLVAAGLVGNPVVPVAVTPAILASAVLSGLLYYGFAYWLYLAALRSVPAAVAATSFYLIPLFGLAAAGLLGERLEPIQWLGAAVVIGAVGGVAVIQRRAGAARGPVTPAPS